MICLFRIDSNILLMMFKRLIGLYCDGEERSPEFLKTGQIEEIFHEVGKHFSLRQRLKILASMGDISGDIFFKTMTGTSSGPVAFDDSRLWISLETSLTDLWNQKVSSQSEMEIQERDGWSRLVWNLKKRLKQIARLCPRMMK